MDNKAQRRQMLRYKPEAWRNDEDNPALKDHTVDRARPSHNAPDVRDQTRILELLGRINYKILSGNRVYIEVGGVVYKTLYGGYWRSVFTGVEHYLLRCEQISGAIWIDDDDADALIDLPIAYSNDGWTARGHSVSFLASKD